MRSWTLTVKGEVFPTANVWLRMQRLRKGRRRSLRVRYQNDVVNTWKLLLLEAGLNDVPVAVRRRRVTIQRHAPGVLPDVPNLYTGADKCILDNLVRHGALVDDNMTWLDLGPIDPVRSKEKKTVIHIEEVA